MDQEDRMDVDTVDWQVAFDNLLNTVNEHIRFLNDEIDKYNALPECSRKIGNLDKGVAWAIVADHFSVNVHPTEPVRF